MEEDHLSVARDKIKDLRANHIEVIAAHCLIVIAEELRIIRKQLGCFLQHSEKINDNETSEIS